VLNVLLPDLIFSSCFCLLPVGDLCSSREVFPSRLRTALFYSPRLCSHHRWFSYLLFSSGAGVGTRKSRHGSVISLPPEAILSFPAPLMISFLPPMLDSPAVDFVFLGAFSLLDPFAGCFFIPAARLSGALPRQF
jgi:hypothetical protein